MHAMHPIDYPRWQTTGLRFLTDEVVNGQVAVS